MEAKVSSFDAYHLNFVRDKKESTWKFIRVVLILIIITGISWGFLWISNDELLVALVSIVAFAPIFGIELILLIISSIKWFMHNKELNKYQKLIYKK